MSLVELLVAITLVGTVGLAVLASLQTSIVASRKARDTAQAQEWLQSATEVLVNDIDWYDCDTTADIQSVYENDLRSKSTIIPATWSSDRLEAASVEFAGPDGAYGPTCYATEHRQKITIQVRNNIGDIIETVQVVKVPVD